MGCPFHGYETPCPDCRKQEKVREQEGVRNGTLVFGVFVWRGDGRYKVQEAIKTYKVKSAAERYADKNNLVVRTVKTEPEGEL